MMMIILLLGALQMNQGVQIDAHDRLDIVRTDQEPATEHHPILDDPRYARLRPFTVNIKTKGGEAIHAIVVEFTVIDANGIRHDLPQFSDGPNDGKFAVVFPGSPTAFWPGGRMTKFNSYKPQGLPLMSSLNEARLDMLEHAKSVTFSVPWIEFEDGMVIDSTGPWTAKVAQSRVRMANQRAQWREK
jgi:hypothetical protein